MKSLELLITIEEVLKWNEITEEQYTKSAWIVESILINNNIKHLYKEEILNHLLMKLYEKKNSYDYTLNIYQRWNYIVKYLTKSMQEVVQIGNNIVDIPLYVIEKGIWYTEDIYESNPENKFYENFHEDIEQELLIEWLKNITTPKENYVLQRWYLDWVKKKDIAKELKVKPRKISSILNKIKKKASAAYLNQY